MAKTATRYTGKELRYLADAYNQGQETRIKTGEQIRAVLQGRDETFIPLWDMVPPAQEGDNPVWIDQQGRLWEDADEVLQAIERGVTSGPVRVMGRTYQRHKEEEDELRREMMHALRVHPAWPWLEKVKGVGPTLACKLLSQLDIERAESISGFWYICGLATVPGIEYHCTTCGLSRSWAPNFEVTGKHKMLNSTKQCSGLLVPVEDKEVRVAMPAPKRGEKLLYIKELKRTLFLIGTSFLKAGEKSPFERYYRSERAKYDQERLDWAEGRKHYAALRKVEKLFLGCLWLYWREAVGLPISDPYAAAQLPGDHHVVRPEDMI